MAIGMLKGVENDLIGYKGSSLGRFRKWHVEALLNQSADLLDRCLRDRAQSRDLQARWDELELERINTERAHKLVDDQVAAGSLEIELTKLTQEINDKASQNAKHRDVVHWLWEFYKPHKNPDAHAYRANALQAEIAEALHLVDLAVKGMQLEWESKSKVFRQQGISDAKYLRALKNDKMQSGSLNFKDQFIALEAGIKRDFEDAFDRILVAYDGLVEFYAFDKHPAHLPPPRLNPTVDNMGPIDVSTLWVRNAIRWLIAFGQLDQTWTFTVSIRQLVGELEWQQQLATKGLSAKLSFSLPKELFESHTFTRMRGLSLFAIGNVSKDYPLAATIRLPKYGLSYQIPQHGDSGTYAKIDQSELPMCYLGRVSTRESPRPPEIAGVVSVANASPISDIDSGVDSNWHIELVGSSRSNTDLSALEDISMELTLTGRPE